MVLSIHEKLFCLTLYCNGLWGHLDVWKTGGIPGGENDQMSILAPWIPNQFELCDDFHTHHEFPIHLNFVIVSNVWIPILFSTSSTPFACMGVGMSLEGVFFRLGMTYFPLFLLL